MNERLKEHSLISTGHKDSNVQLAALKAIQCSGVEINLPETWRIVNNAFADGSPEVKREIIEVIANNSNVSVDGMFYVGKLMHWVWDKSVMEKYIDTVLSIECKTEARQELVRKVFFLERYDLSYKVCELYSIHPEFVSGYLIDENHICTSMKSLSELWESVAKLCWADEKAFETLFVPMYKEYVDSEVIDEAEKKINRSRMVEMLCRNNGRPCGAVEKFLLSVGENEDDAYWAASIALARLTMFSGDAVNTSVIRANELKNYAYYITLYSGKDYENVIDLYTFQDMLVSHCMILGPQKAIYYMKALVGQKEIVLPPSVVIRAMAEYASNETYDVFPLALMVLGKAGLTDMITSALCVVGDKHMASYYEAIAESFRVRSKAK